MKPKAIVMSGYGINSEEETLHVFEQVGVNGKIVHINDVIDGREKLDDYQILVFPGGFAYGDDTGSGNAYANKMRNNLWDEVEQFASEDKLILGICNGCQILANLGLIPGFEHGKRESGMMHNASARLECRWVDIAATSEKCIWTQNLEIVHCPVAHGEGRFYFEEETLKKMKDGDQIVFKYVNEDGSPADGKFPVNPNGSIEDIAGICDPSGRIMGMMPHPERNWSFYNQNDWPVLKEKLRREGKDVPEEGAGMAMFKNAAQYFK